MDSAIPQERRYSLNETVGIALGARMTGLHPDTLRRWAKSGKIQYCFKKLGGEWRVPVAELQKLMSGKELMYEDLAEEVPDQLLAIRTQAGELNYAHYSDRITDLEIRQYLVSSMDSPNQLSLSGDVAVADAILSIHAKRYSEQSSVNEAAWNKAIACFNRFRKSQQNRDAEGVARDLNELEAIFKGARRGDHEKKIREWQKHKAHLIRVETERLAKGGEYLTADDAMRITADKLQAVLLVVKEHCPPDIQKKIVSAIQQETHSAVDVDAQEY